MHVRRHIFRVGTSRIVRKSRLSARSQTTAIIGLLALASTLPSVASADLAQDVPEANTYAPLFDLNLPTKASYHTQAPAYTTNAAASWQGTFDRVAYFLELQKTGEPRRYVWVSMDAFTTDPKALAIPHAGGGGVFQNKVSNLTIVSNQPGVTAGVAIATGNLEMWPGNYVTANDNGIPGASSTLYDTGDSPVAGAGYGSFQVHNYGTKTTLFAYNSWGAGGAVADLGIGNNTKAASNGSTHADWTFRHNAAEYTLRRLRVFVRKGPTPAPLTMNLTSPQPHQVVQRDGQGLTWVRVAGTLTQIGTRVEARAIATQSGTTTGWMVVDPKPGKSFVGHLQVSQGWYGLEVRLKKGKELVGELKSGPFGVGEVFITAGQSNSANHGKPAQSPKDQRIGAWGPAGWQLAADPQPIATGAGGTPWPALGDLLLAKFGVPIGFISVGWGGTSVAQWQPGDAKQLFPRLQLAIDELGPYGVRAVLWHQGESDAAGKTTQAVYTKRLQALIAASRKEAGWELPWYIARVGYLPNLAAGDIAAVVAGQQAVIDADPAVFPGAKTDDLVGAAWRHDNVHFNTAGLQEHAKRWAALIPAPVIAPPTGPDAGAGDSSAGDAGSTKDAGATTDAGVAVSSDTQQPSDTGSSASDSISNKDASAAADTTALDAVTSDGNAGTDLVAPDGSNSGAAELCVDPAPVDEGCGAALGSNDPPWATLLVAILGLLALRRRRRTMRT